MSNHHFGDVNADTLVEDEPSAATMLAKGLREEAYAVCRELETFDRRLKPEGITRFANGAREFIFIVFDTSGYAATD